MASNFLTQVTDKNGNVLEIEMRADGYFNASKMCKSTKKQWNHYFDRDRAREFFEELSCSLDIPVTPSTAESPALIVCKKGGTSPGTWVHRKVRHYKERF